jgi:hypothetical protein
MEESYIPEKVRKDYLTGHLNKESAVDLLISLIETSDDTEIRIESINVLRDIKIQNQIIFKILENLILSDESVRVRDSALHEILDNYLEQAKDPIVWIIEHENSPIILRRIFDFFETIDPLEYGFILEKIAIWFRKYSSNLGISIEESRFFLDLEVIFATDKPNYEINYSSYKFFQKLSDIKGDDPWLLIKKKHVEALNLNYFNWKYIKDNQDVMNSFLNLYDLNTYLETLKKYDLDLNAFDLPTSIGKLTNLKKLILKKNNLKDLPNSIVNLQNLNILDLSQNLLNEIPSFVSSFKSLEKLNLKNNNIQTIPEDMKPFLNSLKEFRI